MADTLPRLFTVALGAALLATAGCARIRDHKGYVIDQTLVAAIQPGVDNKESVTRTLGRPSFDGQFDGGNSWYYVARDTRQLAFASPTPVDQTVIIIHFDKAGNVASVQKTGLEKVVRISPDSDKTPTLGRHRGFFRELFGNIGQVGSVSQGGGTVDNPQ
ncbi:MAG TPA: outer membrane protein assembly factor BamE [Sphingomonadaceae bacterium]|jgi:outer membrane protein assembly factor BamE (lipoprotein component of BamABCDE complex)|nr:outer membrane protein assembly factor BamE [Sphingomonadaceae bacterium]